MPYLESPNTGSTPPTWDTGGELILRVGFLLACSIEEEFIDEDDDDDSLVRLLTELLFMLRNLLYSTVQCTLFTFVNRVHSQSQCYATKQSGFLTTSSFKPSINPTKQLINS